MSGSILGNYRLMTARNESGWLAADENLAAPFELLEKVQTDLSGEINVLDLAADSITDLTGLNNLQQLYTQITDADTQIENDIADALANTDLLTVDIPAYDTAISNKIAAVRTAVQSSLDGSFNSLNNDINIRISALDTLITDSIETPYIDSGGNLGTNFDALQNSLGLTGVGNVGVIKGGDTTLSPWDLGNNGAVVSSKVLERFSITDYHVITMEVNQESNRLMFVETKQTDEFGNLTSRVLLSLNI